MKIIFHNLGLGDHIVCNGLVRELYFKHKEISLLVLDKNYNNVKFMFSDLDNLNLMRIDNDCDPYLYVSTLNQEDVINLAGSTNGVGFEKAFYDRAGLDFDKKWDSFYLPRNFDREKECFEGLNLKQGNYVFVHEWNGLKIPDINGFLNVRPLKELGGVFDFCYIIENAKEIHCMESSFKNLIEFLDVKTDKLFFYNIGRTRSRSKSNLNWKVYDK